MSSFSIFNCSGEVLVEKDTGAFGFSVFPGSLGRSPAGPGNFRRALFMTGVVVGLLSLPVLCRLAVATN